MFLKEWHRDVLDGKLAEINTSAAVIQKFYRGFQTREKFRTLVKGAQQEAQRKLVSVDFHVNPLSARHDYNSLLADQITVVENC